MAPSTTTRDIRNYFTANPLSNSTDQHNEQKLGEYETTMTRLVVKSSDDEESSSDTSLEDLADLLQASRSTHLTRPSGSIRVTDSQVQIDNARNLRNGYGSSQLKPSKPAFDLKTLARMNNDHEETEANSSRVQAIFANNSQERHFTDSDFDTVRRSELLKDVVNENDSDRVLRAVERTETMKLDRSWYFFDIYKKDVVSRSARFPSKQLFYEWQKEMYDSRQREQLVLFGFVRDMVTLGEGIPDEVFMWLLREICLEERDDLRRAYCGILLAMPEKIHQLVLSEDILNLFYELGSMKEAVDLEERLQPVDIIPNAYDGREWTKLEILTDFLGKASSHTTFATRRTILLVLSRLCVDLIVQYNTSLLAAIQQAVCQCCSSLTEKLWNNFCNDICASLCRTIDQSFLQLRILQCLPPLNNRMHELRRRLAFSFFFGKRQHSDQSTHQLLDISKVMMSLDSARFHIDRATDFPELTASFSILDIAMDNGRSSKIDAGHKDGELLFNYEIDRIEEKIVDFWTAIPDAAGGHTSRIDAKETLDAMRARLKYTIRTRPIMIRTPFDPPEEDNGKSYRQSTFNNRPLGERAG